jgi:hypothetical protein
VTSRERSLVEDAYDALQAGDANHAAELILIALDDGPIVNDTRCRYCRRWPGEQWTCPNVRACALLAEVA